jgi:hypothetical protein
MLAIAQRDVPKGPRSSEESAIGYASRITGPTHGEPRLLDIGHDDCLCDAMVYVWYSKELSCEELVSRATSMRQSER